MNIRVAIGQDSHRFSSVPSSRPLILGGLVFPGFPPLEANSDGDVVLHAITNAISGISGVNILGAIADKMCLEEGIVDSSQYLAKALEFLQGRIVHLSISIEGSRPPISPRVPEMAQSIGNLLGISPQAIGITATSGEGLTAFGQGKGIQVFVCITVAL